MSVAVRPVEGGNNEGRCDSDDRCGVCVWGHERAFGEGCVGERVGGWILLPSGIRGGMCESHFLSEPRVSFYLDFLGRITNFFRA